MSPFHSRLSLTLFSLSPALSRRCDPSRCLRFLRLHSWRFCPCSPWLRPVRYVSYPAIHFFETLVFSLPSLCSLDLFPLRHSVRSQQHACLMSFLYTFPRLQLGNELAADSEFDSISMSYDTLSAESAPYSASFVEADSEAFAAVAIDAEAQADSEAAADINARFAVDFSLNAEADADADAESEDELAEMAEMTEVDRDLAAFLARDSFIESTINSNAARRRRGGFLRRVGRAIRCLFRRCRRRRRRGGRGGGGRRGRRGRAPRAAPARPVPAAARPVARPAAPPAARRPVPRRAPPKRAAPRRAVRRHAPRRAVRRAVAKPRRAAPRKAAPKRARPVPKRVPPPRSRLPKRIPMPKPIKPVARKLSLPKPRVPKRKHHKKPVPKRKVVRRRRPAPRPKRRVVHKKRRTVRRRRSSNSAAEAAKAAAAKAAAAKAAAAMRAAARRDPPLPPSRRLVKKYLKRFEDMYKMGVWTGGATPIKPKSEWKYSFQKDRNGKVDLFMPVPDMMQYEKKNEDLWKNNVATNRNPAAIKLVDSVGANRNMTRELFDVFPHPLPKLD